MGGTTKPKKEPHYRIKIVCTLYGVIFYLYAPVIIEKITHIELSRNMSTTVSILLAGILSFWFLPKVVKIPSSSTIRENLNQIGFRRPTKIYLHISLGIILAMCTLSGMFIGSKLISEYVFNTNMISFDQIYFSLLPGIFEEIIFRGFIMAIFIGVYKDIRKAALIQCIVFVVLHIGSFEMDWLRAVDLLGVFAMAIAFTYVALKTRNLLAGIIFHTLHDAFLFVVQPSQDFVYSPMHALLFYSSLIISILIAIGITNLIVKKNITPLHEV